MSKQGVTIHNDGVMWDEPVFTLSEAAARLSVSSQTLNRWDRDGRFVARRITLSNHRVYRYYTQSMLDVVMCTAWYLELPQFAHADIIGKRFGKLVVIDYTINARKRSQFGSYTCQCDCGNVCEVPRSLLLSGRKKSCGCRFEDLTGRRFGRWLVLRQVPSILETNGAYRYRYLCRCDCGTERIVIAGALRSGASRSCGCLHREVVSETHLNDLTGMQFGKLTVLSYKGSQRSASGKSQKAMWLCECECGRQVIVSRPNLISGYVDACPYCSPIKGASVCERNVRLYLETRGLFDGDGYVQYKTFPELVGLGGGSLSYDFEIRLQNQSILIECQGEQHFRPVAWFGGQEYFVRVREHDRRKRAYAKSHGLMLIEIPFDVVSYDAVTKFLEKSIGKISNSH